MKSETSKHVVNLKDTNPIQPTVISVEITPLNILHKKLQQWGVLPKNKHLTIFRLTTGTCERMAELMLSVDEKLLTANDGNIIPGGAASIARDSSKLVKIIAVAITNRGGRSSWLLERFIKKQFDQPSLYQVLQVALYQMDLLVFMSSVHLIKGIDTLSKPEEKSAEANNLKSLLA